MCAYSKRANEQTLEVLEVIKLVSLFTKCMTIVSYGESVTYMNGGTNL